MPWKMVTRHGKNVTRKEAVDRILNKKNPKIENLKEEIESEKKLKRNVKNIMKNI